MTTTPHITTQTTTTGLVTTCALCGEHHHTVDSLFGTHHAEAWAQAHATHCTPTGTLPHAVACPRCGAAENHPCQPPTAPAVPRPCHARVTAWATQTACCPACQVEPGVPCHLDGRPLHHGHVHPQRETEARQVAV